MKKVNPQSLLAILSLVMMVTACGKNMSLQAPSTKNNTTNLKDMKNIDDAVVRTRLPSADAITDKLEALSAFDMKDPINSVSPTALVRRAILHVEPKEAVLKVSKLALILDHAVITNVKDLSICTLTMCTKLDAFIKDAKATSIEIDLKAVFLDKKTDAEVMDWIYDNTTAFAKPGYRKMILSFEGITSIVGGEVVYKTEVLNDKLPKDFNSTPVSFENDESDLYTPGIKGPSEKPIAGVKPAVVTATATDTSTGSTTATTTGTATDTTTATNTATNTSTTTSTSSATLNTPECAQGLMYVVTKDAKGCYGQGSCKEGQVEIGVGSGNCINLSDINTLIDN